MKDNVIIARDALKWLYKLQQVALPEDVGEDAVCKEVNAVLVQIQDSIWNITSILGEAISNDG